ncbi:suppressor APC domain-containing protein 1 isoform X1 [Fundulus heteroclitus]|uniref:suppressor APC domain-containing protein 1 isoform X1 n=1 Tax=Fundulus heteroclitus TaxID=8078 RepID=UPI00165BBAFF|nr:suppressor APC domain-containing protein 1 isoform X1 [Fundulus heteroclitus]
MGQPSVCDLLSMACHLSTSGSYTVVIIPLRTGLYSQEALRFYLWIKRMKDLEKEKDALWSGLEVLEKSRLWYVQRLVENRNLRSAGSRNGTAVYRKRRAEVQGRVWILTTPKRAPPSCLPTHIQRVNGSLGSIMSEPTVSSNPCLSDPLADSDLRWQNTVLTKKVSEKNRRISRLELERKALLEELEDLQAC